jgi:mannose/cellobiose epimerase-like protein (N-acyl-D-glucosamine 2-epimerase family)
MEAQQRLLNWLIADACPLWSTRGVDRVGGGFEELLRGTEPVTAPRRVRVQPRQVAAFVGASRLGWDGDARGLAAHGLNYVLSKYRRADGLFRTLISADGASLDDRALLYDQAFVLLGLAEAHRVAPTLGADVEARALRALIFCHYKQEGPGFESDPEGALPLSSNAHMHLLEACLAWMEVHDEDSEWRALADGIGELALSRFIDARSGALREHFSAGWFPVPGLEGRMLEPGHHFEWAWLLLRWSADRRADARQAALRLIDIGERYGVFNGLAVNALLDDFTVHDASARLWPQTERLKAAALAARLTGDRRYWATVTDAAAALSRYLETPVAGSWYDRITPDGRIVEEPAPASSFYHIVLAILETSNLIRACL